jgi:hypothetical protein
MRIDSGGEIKSRQTLVISRNSCFLKLEINRGEVGVGGGGGGGGG